MNIMTVKHLGASLVLIGALAGCNTSKTPDAAPSASGSSTAGRRIEAMLSPSVLRISAISQPTIGGWSE